MLFSYPWTQCHAFSCVTLVSPSHNCSAFFLIFNDLHTLWNTSHFFCKTSLNTCLLEAFLWLYWDSAFWARISQKWYCVLLRASYQGIHDIKCFIDYDISFNHLIKTSVFVVVFGCNVTIFPHVINKFLFRRDRYFATMLITCFSSSFVQWFLHPLEHLVCNNYYCGIA